MCVLKHHPSKAGRQVSSKKHGFATHIGAMIKSALESCSRATGNDSPGNVVLRCDGRVAQRQSSGLLSQRLEVRILSRSLLFTRKFGFFALI